MNFHGRKRELRLLNNFTEQNQSGIAVVYGRRRVGKTTLIREAFKDF